MLQPLPQVLPSCHSHAFYTLPAYLLHTAPTLPPFHSMQLSSSLHAVGAAPTPPPRLPRAAATQSPRHTYTSVTPQQRSPHATERQSPVECLLHTAHTCHHCDAAATPLHAAERHCTLSPRPPLPLLTLPSTSTPTAATQPPRCPHAARKQVTGMECAAAH